VQSPTFASPVCRLGPEGVQYAWRCPLAWLDLLHGLLSGFSAGHDGSVTLRVRAVTKTCRCLFGRAFRRHTRIAIRSQRHVMLPGCSRALTLVSLSVKTHMHAPCMSVSSCEAAASRAPADQRLLLG
jgi:hypothetical protein